MILAYLWKTFKIVFIGVSTVLVIETFIVEPGRVNGPSMIPTFVDNEVFYVNKFTLLFNSPTRQQIVQIKNPFNGSILNIKRIIGIPGDTVHIRNNVVTITDSKGVNIPLNESYLMTGAITQTWNNESGDIKLGRDQYYVMGDNRRESGDSRHFGPILRKDILGAVMN